MYLNYKNIFNLAELYLYLIPKMCIEAQVTQP